MDIKQFSRWMLSKKKELEDLRRRKMPVIVGAMAQSHYKDNFRKGGFVNNGLNKWKPPKRLSSGSKSAGSNYPTLTSGRNHLMNSIKYVPGDARVKIVDNVDHASIHNEGGTINSNPEVTPKMRKFAWAQYYAAGGGKKGADSKPLPLTDDAERWKRLALTKKKKLKIKITMPKRQFIGESEELNKKISDKWDEEIGKILDT